LKLVDVQEVLFIPLQITPFSPEKILRWQDILFDFVPSSQLRAGFADLAEWQKGNYAPNRLLADESIQDMSGHMVMSFDLPLPDINDPMLEDDDDPIPETHNFGPGWSFYKASRFSLFTRKFYKSYFYRRTYRTRQQVWETQVIPKIVPEFMEELEIWANTPSGAVNLKLDITQLTRFRHGAKMSVKLATTSSTPPIRRSDIQSLEIRSGRQVPSNARILIESASLSYRAESLNGFIFRDTRLQNDIGNSDTARIVTPLNAEEMRNPRKEQERRANTLIEHLNLNREIYHEILAKEMDEHRRFMLLDGIRLPSAGNRSVANLVENRVVGFAGNSMILPVAQGLRIDPIFHEITDLFEFYSPIDEPEPFRMSLPTGGYFMEAVMGTCNSCEDLDYTKARFNGFACEDEPSGIEPVSMDSRRTAPSDLQAKDFAAPIVAFQNVPNAPDPTSLGAAMQALGNSDTFRDATGLAATQANAMAALAKTADGAEAMANISADLTKQAFAGIADVTVDRDLARIQDQLDKGNISTDDAKGMIKDVLGNKANSTQAPSDNTKASILDKPEVQGRIKEGANVDYSGNGENISLTKGEPLEPIDKSDLNTSVFKNENLQRYLPNAFDLSSINVNDPSTYVKHLFPIQTANSDYAIVEVFGAANNLNDQVAGDLLEVLEAQRNSKTTFLALIDISDQDNLDVDPGAYVIEISPNGGLQVIEKWVQSTSIDSDGKRQDTHIDIGKSEILTCFMIRALLTMQSIDNIAIGFWSHGSGAGTFAGSGQVYEAYYGSSKIDITEVSNVINVALNKVERSKVDLIFTDSCLNGNLELANQLKSNCEVYVGSQLSVPGQGYNYKTLIENMTAFAPQNPQDWARHFLYSYYLAYKGSGVDSNTLSAYTMAVFPTFLFSLGELTDEIISQDDKVKFIQAVNSSKMIKSGSWPTHAYDLAEVLKRYRLLISDPVLKSTCEDTIRMLVDADRGFYIAHTNMSQISGVYERISTWIPTEIGYLNAHKDEYKNFDFSADAKWLDFLNYLVT